VKVLDFGLAKVAPPTDQGPASGIATKLKTSPGVMIGTVQYMSPEQALGRDLDHRTDIFSLGVVLYELATGRLPFSGTTTTEIIDRIVNAQPEAIARFNYDVPAELERIIRKCLEKDPERRYQSTREFLVDLKNLKRDSNAVAGTMLQSRKYRSRKTINSLAVLPLINATANPDTEYLCDGITENIINSLSQLPRLRVMARGTVFRFKGQEVDPREVGNALGVGAVLAGRVLHVGDVLVIRTELVDTTDGSQLWGAQFNRKFSDVLIVQEEIAFEVAEKLRLKLSRREEKQLGRQHTKNTEAYQLYLKGRHFWNKMTTEGVQRGIQYFQEAIDIDPSYALAYAGISDCYASLSNFGALSPRDALPKARAAAVKALELDGMVAEAHTALGYVKTIYDWDWDGAEKEFKRAIELKNSDEWSHEAYGWYLSALGRFDESTAEMKRAQEIDPLSLSAATHIGIPFYYARNYNEAIRQFRKALEVDPNFSNARFRLGLAYEQNGMNEEAIAEFQKVLNISGDRDAMAAIGHVYGLSGQRDAARDVLAELKNRSRQEYVPSYDLAIIHVGLGETDQAFERLEEAYEERSYWLSYLGVDPILDGLRRDPRFADLLRRVGLAGLRPDNF
jgi:TolB-like protein/Tfp pilus assembly protein PilF